MSYGQNALAESYEEVTVLNRPMLFTNSRIDRASVPKGLYVYDVRHDDECQGIPVEIADFILVNHWGTLISSRPIKLDAHSVTGKKYRLIDEETEWNYEGIASSLQEYMEKHPPRKAKKPVEER